MSKNMPAEQRDYTRTIMVKATPAAAFASINAVSSWWDGQVKGRSERLGDIFDYRYADIHYSKQEVVELVPDRRVAWRVLEAKLSFLADPTEWTGTTITFDIASDGEMTQIRFTHLGLKPAIECYDSCSDAWNGLIGRSLKSLVELGRGVRTLSGE